MDDDLGLSDRDKELKKWNAPYRYQEFPKMLYRGRTVAGRVEVEQRIVASEGEAGTATTTGWVTHPTRAVETEDARLAAPGTAAAERAWTDRQMSERAQAEAAAADQAAGTLHLGEIPARPRRPRPSRSKAKKELS